MSFRKSLLIAGVAVAALTTAACSPANDRTVNDSASGSLNDTAGGMARVDSIRVVEVLVGKGTGTGADMRVTTASDTFAVRDTIHATVRTTGAGANTIVTARWMFQDTVTVQEQTETISPTGGEAFTSFHLTKATAWPRGEYKLVVLLNGREVETETFRIK